MDTRIYRPSIAESGIYATRRFPKGSSSNSAAPASSGSGALVDVTALKPNPYFPPLWRTILDEVGPVLARIVWDYTIPQGRRGICQNAGIQIVRKTVGGGPSFCGASIFIFRKGRTYPNNAFGFPDTAEKIIGINDVIIAAAGTGEKREYGGTSIDLFEGDRIFSLTSDASAGGTLDWDLFASVVEFDAAVNTPTQQNNDSRFAAAVDSGVKYEPASKSSPTPSGYNLSGIFWRPL